MPDIARMGSTAPLFEQREIETPVRRTAVAETSRTAWDGKQERLRGDYLTILRFLAEHGPSVHDSIVAAGLLLQSSSGRMGELVTAGLVGVVGKGKTRSGAMAKLCGITDAGREAIK